MCCCCHACRARWRASGGGGEADIRLRRISAKALANLSSTGEDTAAEIRAAVRSAVPHWRKEAAGDNVLSLYVATTCLCARLRVWRCADA